MASVVLHGGVASPTTNPPPFSTGLGTGHGGVRRKFTKLLKPVYATLRQSGHLSSSYIDDSYLQGDNFNDCVTSVIATIKLLDSLGFVIHSVKSVLVSSQRITYLFLIR